MIITWIIKYFHRIIEAQKLAAKIGEEYELFF